MAPSQPEPEAEGAAACLRGGVPHFGRPGYAAVARGKVNDASTCLSLCSTTARTIMQKDVRFSSHIS
jgi:hypothetical protein